MLGLADYPPPAPLELIRPSRQVNPAIALGWSLLCPGLGHLYIGFYRRAAWIFGMEVLCALFLATEGNLHAAALLSIPAIYCFALIDAYFTAREWNAGATYILEGHNPRIAAVLNLLTKGFGYFYLGDRTKGIICFFVIIMMQSLLLLHSNVWTSILAITLKIGIALDGYRVARQTLHQQYPDLTDSKTLEDGAVAPGLIDAANPAGLKPAAASVFFTIVCGAVLIGYGALQAMNGHLVSSRGTIEQGPDGFVYTDTKDKFTVVLPEGWNSSNSQHSLALFTGEGTSIVVQEQYSTFTVANLLQATEKQLRATDTDATVWPCTTSLGGHPARCFEISYMNKNKVQISQRIAAVRRGLKIFLFIESWTSSQRPAEFETIEKNLQLR